MGRRPIWGRAMSAAERKRRQRDREKAEKAQRALRSNVRRSMCRIS